MKMKIGLDENTTTLIIGNKNSELANLVVDTKGEENVKFISKKTPIGQFLSKALKDHQDSEVKLEVYFNDRDKSYCYNINFSKFPIDAKHSLLIEKDLAEYYRGLKKQ